MSFPPLLSIRSIPLGPLERILHGSGGVRPSYLLGSALVAFLPSAAGSQGHIELWGNSLQSQVSATPDGSGFTSVDGGYKHSVALRNDGSLVSWGTDNIGQVSNTPTGTGFASVAAGFNHSFALRTDGSIVSWGYDSAGQVSSTPAGAGFTAVDGGIAHSLALRADGSIESWGGDSLGQVSNSPTGAGYLAVSAGRAHSLALRADGSITSWGLDSSGQVSNTPTGSGFIAVVGGGWASLALRADGSLVSWGYDGFGQVWGTPTGTGFTAVSIGTRHSVALRDDGSIVSWGSDHGGSVHNTPDGTGFTLIAAGSSHTLALREFNSQGPYCFGDTYGAACPCGAIAGVGEGCMNSTTTGGATLLGSGAGDLSNDTLQLAISGVPDNKPGLILRGTNQVNGGWGDPTGDGLLCVRGQIARSQIQLTSGGATTFTDFRGQPFGQSSYGEGVQTNYQFWYRDSGNTCSGSGFNFSNAWTTTWLP